MKITFSYHHIDLTTINVTNVLLSRVCKSTYMPYLKNHKRYRHVLGTEISVMPKFIFNFNTFMVLKINAFRAIKEKPNFWTDILDLWAAILEFCVASGIFEKSWV